MVITDPKERKALRDRMIAEYKELTGIDIAFIEKKGRKRGIKAYKPTAIKHLLEISCDYLKLKVSDVVSQSRKAELVRCRQMIAYLLSEMGTTRESTYPILGHKDGSTVNHSIETMKGYLKVDKIVKEEYAKYKEHCLQELDKRKKVNPPSLSPEQIAAIRLSVKKGGIMKKELAEIYGVAKSTIVKYTNEKRNGNKKRSKTTTNS